MAGGMERRDVESTDRWRGDKTKREIDETEIKLKIGVGIRGEEEGNHRVIDVEGMEKRGGLLTPYP